MGNREYVLDLYETGLLTSCLLRPRRVGIAANLRAMAGMTRSKLVIYCDDDQLCPNVEPDWLSREVAAMAERPRLAILSLNNPHGNVGGDKRRKLGRDGPVTYCKRSGGSFMCIRHALLSRIVPLYGEQSPVSYMCERARELGWQNGYLTDTYCRHIGKVSARNGRDLSRAIDLVAPVNMDTLEPPEVYRG
jgi:hypothetical protein